MHSIAISIWLFTLYPERPLLARTLIRAGSRRTSEGGGGLLDAVAVGLAACVALSVGERLAVEAAGHRGAPFGARGAAPLAGRSPTTRPQVSLEAPIARYELRLVEGAERRITVRQLLNQTSGIPGLAGGRLLRSVGDRTGRQVPGGVAALLP